MPIMAKLELIRDSVEETKLAWRSANKPVRDQGEPDGLQPSFEFFVNKHLSVCWAFGPPFSTQKKKLHTYVMCNQLSFENEFMSFYTLLLPKIF